MTLTFLALAALLQTPKDDEAAKWLTYTSPVGFAVSMPGTRVEPKMKIANSRENGTIMTKEGERTYLVISVVNAPPVTKAAEAQSFKDMRAALDKIAKVSSEKTIMVEGHPGREFVYEMTPPKGGDTLVVNSRYILASPEFIYNLQVLHVKDKPAPSDRDLATFFDSFKLIERPKLVFKTFRPQGAGFTVLMPGKPEEATNAVKTAKVSFNLRTFECATPAGSYSVAIFEYGPEVGNAPPEKKIEMLRALNEGFIKEDNGKAIDNGADDQFQGFPRRMSRWTLAVPSSNQIVAVEARLVMVGAKVFVVMAKCPLSLVDPNDPDKFFKSFKLMNARVSEVASNDDPPAEESTRGRPAAAPRLAGRMPAKGATATRGGRVAAAPRPPRPERISWKRYNSAAGGFNINMPGEPTPGHEDDGLLGSKGVEILTALHEETRFIVQYQDLSRTAQKKGSSGVLKAARASDEKVIKGKVVGEKEAMLKGAVGWSYQIESPEPEGPMARVRSYVVGTRLYQIIVVAPKTKFPTDESERFLSSFKLQARN